MNNDDQITNHVDIFMDNMVDKNGLDTITVITSRGDRVGIHSSVDNADIALRIIKIVNENEKSFKKQLTQNKVSKNAPPKEPDIQK